MKKIISLLFILVIFGGSYYYFYINDNQISTTAYEYSKIEKGNIRKTISATGILSFKCFTQTVIRLKARALLNRA